MGCLELSFEEKGEGRPLFCFGGTLVKLDATNQKEPSDPCNRALIMLLGLRTLKTRP